MTKKQHEPITIEEHLTMAKALHAFQDALVRAANTRPSIQERSAIRSCLRYFDKYRYACIKVAQRSISDDTKYEIERQYYNKQLEVLQ